jgi:hypothetical protein
MKTLKKVFGVLFIALVLTAMLTATVLADKPVGNGQGAGSPRSDCTTIQDGGITDSAENPIVLGFDEFGYNYQAHLFVGTYESSDREWGNGYWGDTASDYVDDALEMKWADEWLANVDCDSDGKLDRGLVNGIPDLNDISQGWLTNHVQGAYNDENGQTQHYTYFVKIQYVGLSAGNLWGSYTIVQEVNNDPAAGNHGLSYKTDPGLGH